MSLPPVLRTVVFFALSFATSCAFGGEGEVAHQEQALTADLAPTDSVGALPGSLNVDFDGQAHYTIPIEVPPARADHVPQLAFTYSSSDAIGALGRGWSLSGLSAITRCARSIAIDGAYRAVAYDEEDAFCLDGARLLHVGMVDGVREYRTEQESFVRAFAYEETGVEGPSRWEVRRPDGTIALYGKGSNSQARISSEPRVASWLVSLVRDRFGNLIEVEYDHHYPTDPALDPAVTGARGLVPEVTLKRIRYGSHESGLEATASVTFDYDLRPDVRSGHTAGLTWSQTRRLVRVHTVVGDKSFRTYHLDYETTGATGASRLVSIQDCVQATPGTAASELRDGKVCRPKTTFEWTYGEETLGFDSVTQGWDYSVPLERFYGGALSGFQNIATATPQFVLDVDGDGRTDLVYVDEADRLVIRPEADLSRPSIVTSLTIDDLDSVDPSWHPADVDRDGRDDLVWIRPDSGSSRATVVVARSLGDDFEIREMGQLDAGWLYNGASAGEIRTGSFAGRTYFVRNNTVQPELNESFYEVADFDGDSRPDVLSCEAFSNDNLCFTSDEHFYWRVFNAPPYPRYCPGSFAIRAVDDLGERRAIDVPAFCRNGLHPYLGRRVGDLTGDGVADLLFVDSAFVDDDPFDDVNTASVVDECSELVREESEADAHWKLLTFDRRLGATRERPVLVDTEISYVEHVSPTLADLNGDGLIDVVTLEDAEREGLDGDENALTTRDVILEGRWARMVRHGWINRGDGGFVHVEHDELVDGSMLLADEHSQVLYRKRMCRDAGLIGDFYGDCPRDADRYRWSMESDLAVDLDLDGYSDLWTFGLARDDAERTRTSGDLTYWTRSEYPEQPTLNGRLLSAGDDGVFRERTSPALPSILRGSALVSEGRYEDQSARSRVTRVLDANGDGAPDVLLADVATRAEGLYFDGTRSSARLMINRRARRERVVGVVNGFGERSTVEYRPMSDATVYVYDPACERESDASTACLTGTSLLVARVVTSGAASDRVTSYRYWDGRSATNGRGFLGFAKVSVTDEATNQVSTYRFDRTFDVTSSAYYTARRPVHVTHLVQGRNLKHGGDSSRTLGTELFVDYDLHTHGERWSTVVAQQEVRQFEDVRYLALDPYADEPFAGLTPTHTSTTRFKYGDDVPWSQRDLPFHVASSVDVDRDPAREYSEREYEPEPTIHPGDFSTPWIVGRVSADRSWVEGDGCESDVSVRMKYNPDHGGLETTIRQPDDLAPPRSDEDRRAEVLESHVFFDAYGNLESTIERDLDGNERITKLHYAYPGATFASAAENTLGHTVKAHFHPEIGAPFAIIDPNGLIERTSFDGFGRVVGGSSATGDSFTVRYERRDGDPVPLRVHTSTASGSRAAQGMNAAGQVVWSEWRELRSAVPVTVRALRRYDAAGRVVEESEPFFEGEAATHLTQHEYDDVGTLRVAQSPAGRFTYRRTPDRRMATDALGFETTLVLDGRGNVVQGIEPAPGGTIRHAYCADGRLRQTVDPRGNTTTIEYDTLGRRRYLNEPDRGQEWTDYDAFDQVVHTRDAGHRDVWLEYDAVGRLTRREDVSGKTTWKFDVAPHGLGALASTQSPDGIATEYSYHPNGLLESEKLYADSVTLKLSYGYDAFGRPETIESPVMRTRAEYAAGMLLHVRNAATGASLWEGRTYSARGDLREERFGNGLVATREYQPGTGRLTRQLVRRSSTRLQDWTYGHDANGRVTSRRDALNSFQETYDFDPLGRLTKVTSSHDPTLSLQYDVVGNLTWASDVGTLSYDGTSKPHAVRGFRGVEQQYDSVGNHLGDATRRRVEYNALDLPNNILRRADGKSIQIRYDADGNRAATHGPDGDRYYLGPVEMRGGVFVHRVQVGGRTVAQAMRKDGTTRVDVAYVHDDHLGSTDLVTDASGNVQARFSYDAWGGRKTRAWTSSPAGPDGTPLLDHGYTGHEHDDEWGVIHMRGRAYDPAMRRMTGVDPFVVNPFGVQAFNRYSYVLNDPINSIDPSGFLCVTLKTGTVCGTHVDFRSGSTVTGGAGDASTPVATPAPAAPSPAEHSTPRASLPSLDAAVHRVAQTALNGLDQGTVWGNPSATNVAGAINRFSQSPGLFVMEGVAYTYVRGTLEDVETASDINASTGARASAIGWLALEFVGVGILVRLGRGAMKAGTLARRLLRYVQDIYRQTGLRVHREQIRRLASLLRSQRFAKISSEALAAQRRAFGRLRVDLIRQWEIGTGRTWPRYTDDVFDPDTGLILRSRGQLYDAHHIIELKYGGPNAWWNLHPAAFPAQHQGGIHRAGAPIRDLMP